MKDRELYICIMILEKMQVKVNYQRFLFIKLKAKNSFWKIKRVKILLRKCTYGELKI